MSTESQRPVQALDHGSAANVQAGTQSAAQRDGRLSFVHGLRGIAALAVALFHCYGSTPVADRVTATMSSMAEGTMRLGVLGVDPFFVISGFVISLTPYKRLSTFGE